MLLVPLVSREGDVSRSCGTLDILVLEFALLRPVDPGLSCKVTSGVDIVKPTPTPGVLLLRASIPGNGNNFGLRFVYFAAASESDKGGIGEAPVLGGGGMSDAEIVPTTDALMLVPKETGEGALPA